MAYLRNAAIAAVIGLGICAGGCRTAPKVVETTTPKPYELLVNSIRTYYHALYDALMGKGPDLAGAEEDLEEALASNRLSEAMPLLKQGRVHPNLSGFLHQHMVFPMRYAGKVPSIELASVNKVEDGVFRQWGAEREYRIFHCGDVLLEPFHTYSSEKKLDHGTMLAIDKDKIVYFPEEEMELCRQMYEYFIDHKSELEDPGQLEARIGDFNAFMTFLSRSLELRSFGEYLGGDLEDFAAGVRPHIRHSNLLKLGMFLEDFVELDGKNSQWHRLYLLNLELRSRFTALAFAEKPHYALADTLGNLTLGGNSARKNIGYQILKAYCIVMAQSRYKDIDYEGFVDDGNAMRLAAQLPAMDEVDLHNIASMVFRANYVKKGGLVPIKTIVDRQYVGAKASQDLMRELLKLLPKMRKRKPRPEPTPTPKQREFLGV